MTLVVCTSPRPLLLVLAPFRGLTKDCDPMTQLRCFHPDRNDDPVPGGLLQELEARQDDLLAQLDGLNAKVEAVLLQLGIRLDEPHEPSFPALIGDEG